MVGGRLFISYARKDQAHVYPFVQALSEAGVEVWIDREEIEPLDEFPARIRDGLGRCHALLAWYSFQYAQSSYCQRELTAAWICAQRLTRDVLSRILVVNPEEGVAHIALGDVGRQNYLAGPGDLASRGARVRAIRERLIGLTGDFSTVHEFKPPEWHPFLLRGSPRFVGRLRELWRAHTALNPVGISDHEDPGPIAQITGLGGIGKTLLAIEYARRFGAAYPGGIHWLRFSGLDSAGGTDADSFEREHRRQLENLALLHRLPVKDRDFREVCRDLGSELGAGGPYLWIVDDLPPGVSLEQSSSTWRAPSVNGRTLITTRSKDYSGLGVAIAIDGLEPAAALELLSQDRTPRTPQERQEAEALAEDLGRHALALDVAGHFLLKTMSFTALRQELARADVDPLGRLAESWSGQLPGGHEKSIVATVMQSVRRIDEEGLNLLRIAAELHPGTPISLRLANQILRPLFTLDDQASHDYVTRAVSQLEAHSLVTISLVNDGDAVSFHPLVRYAVLHGDPAGTAAAVLRRNLRTTAVLALITLLKAGASGQRERRLALELAHARHLTQEPNTLEEVELVGWLAGFESDRGQHGEARRLLVGILPLQERAFGADDWRTLATRHNIADATGRAGNAKEGLRLYRELLPDEVRVLGQDFPATLATYHNIAFLTGETGDIRMALRLLQQLLPYEVRVLGPDDPSTLQTRQTIAHWLGQMGATRQALQLSRELLPDATRVLGADHPSTLAVRHTIANLTGESGDPKTALRMYQELLPAKENVLGRHHPSTLAVSHNIAHLTGETGRPQEALRLFLALLPEQQRVLGVDHPDTFATRSNIARWTGSTGDAGAALLLCHALLRDQIQLLGPDHPWVFKTRDNIAFWTRKTGWPLIALRLYRELLHDQGRALGRDDPGTLRTRAKIVESWIRLPGAVMWRILRAPYDLARFLWSRLPRAR